MLINHKTGGCRVVAIRPGDDFVEFCPTHPDRRLVYLVTPYQRAVTGSWTCGGSYIRARYTTNYCSTECRNADKREYGREYARTHRPSRAGEAPPAQDCACYGQSFKPDRRDTRFCSPGCRVKAHRAGKGKDAVN